MEQQSPCTIALGIPKPHGAACAITASQCKRTCSPAVAQSPPGSSTDWSGMKHPGWHILLQQPVISQDTQLLCTLLSCSKSVFAAMASGNVDVHYTLSPEHHLRQGQQLGAWLARFGSIVRQIKPDSSKWVRRHGMSAAEAAIAAGLHAAAEKAPLHLQVYKTVVDGLSNGDVLLALPPSHLTKLELQLNKTPAADASRCATALAGLTSLRSLILAENVCSSSSSTAAAGSSSAPEDNSFIGSLLPALGNLAQLTKLSIPAPRSAAVITCLPGQLQELAFTAQYNFNSQVASQPAMDLSHLTALTRLECFHSLQPGDALPRQLKVVQLPDVGCVEALLGLQQLEAIVLPASEWGNLPNERPTDIFGCEQLKHVEIAYHRVPFFVISSEAPVKRSKQPKRGLGSEDCHDVCVAAW